MTDSLDHIRIWADAVLGESHKIGSELAGKSGLPGGLDGPADAMRHILRATMLYYDGTDMIVDGILGARESIGGALFSRKPGMDHYNNGLGKTIASNAKSKRDAMSLSLELIEKSLAAYSEKDIANWQPAKGGDGYVIPPTGEITLNNGTKVSPIAIYPPSHWKARAGVSYEGAPQWPDAEGKWREGMMKELDTMMPEQKPERRKGDASHLPHMPTRPVDKSSPTR